jgi:hypothetical protein
MQEPLLECSLRLPSHGGITPLVDRLHWILWVACTHNAAHKEAHVLSRHHWVLGTLRLPATSFKSTAQPIPLAVQKEEQKKGSGSWGVPLLLTGFATKC